MSQTKRPKPSGMGVSHFPETDDEARERYLAYKSVDPFPEIPSALLNSADLSDYVAATGLIFPFREDEDDLKAAAHRVRMLGDIVYWGSDGEKRTCALNDGDEFRLTAHSITYITLEPFFRIPDYIKVWFHLDASHVYKGLYLNASFIDPGFVGRLSLPLHNPTANEYVLRARDSLIWITLMKISPLPQWGQHGLFAKVRRGKFREFPERKKRQTIDDHLERAVGRDGSVRSAIPVVSQTVLESVRSAELFAKEASDSAREVKVAADRFWKHTLALFAFVIAVLGIAIAVVTLLFMFNSSYRPAEPSRPRPEPAPSVDGTNKTNEVNQDDHKKSHEREVESKASPAGH